MEKELYTASEARKALGGIAGESLRRLVDDGKIRKIIPAGNRKRGLYIKEDIEKLISERAQITPDTDKVFTKATQEVPMWTSNNTGASFMRATSADMDALYKMAVKLFPHTVGPERRKEWIRHEPRGHYIMRRADGSVVAYLYLLALKRNRQDLEPAQRDRLALYLRRELRNTDITANDIHQLAPGQPVDIVIGGIGSDPDLEKEQRTEYTSLLLRGARRDLENLGREGFIFSNSYAFSETKDGITLCVKMGMSQWEPPRGKFYTFQLDILKSPSILFKGYVRGLSEYQAQKNNA